MSRAALRSSCFVLFAMLALAIVPAVGAQQDDDQTPAADRHAWYAAHVELADASPFNDLPWQFLGPTNISGRMTDVAVVAPRGRSYTMFVAGASGGVWRTKNEGVSWEPVFQHAASTAIGDVTIAPSNQDIVWIGTGEANIFRSSMAGAGVYRSMDGGDTWEYRGLAETHTIPRILIHPTDPDTVYVAASGNEWTRNADRGVYKTTNGGDSWDKILFVDEGTSAIDLVFDPRDPETIYAATWERTRLKWSDPRNSSATAGSGVWKTTDGGANWRQINEGLPLPHQRGRIGLDVSASNPDTVYAFVDNYDVARMPEEGETDAYGRPRAPIIKGATVFRSDDGGETWRQTSEDNQYMQGLGGTYGWVFGQIRVDPVNPDKIYVMGLALNVSEDSGKTFRRLTGMHGDHHGLWIDPENTDYLVNVNDGGLAISYDGGENWREYTDNLPLVQFFNVGYDMAEPNFSVYGSVQDHGSFRGVVDLSAGRANIPAVEWDRAPGGEGSTHVVDPTDPDTVYAAGFYGSIFRADPGMNEVTQLAPQPPEGELPYRGQWIAPFIISPHNPRVLYLGLNHLFRSMNRGDNWDRISPDLTYNDPDKYGDIPFQTIYSISESPFEFGRVYVGTDDGRVWSTNNSGASWDEITGELPRDKVIAEMVASKWDPDVLYAAQNGKRDDDFRPLIWKSTDRGATWQDIAAGIPSGPVNVIREDPKNPDILYVGTDIGVYVTLDGAQSWHALPGGLPSTFVHDIIIHPRTDMLIAATHGRGMWALDVRPLQQLSADVRSSAVHVFAHEPVTMPQGRGFFFGGGNRPGAAVYVWLGQSGTASIEITSSSGEAVRSMSIDGKAGLNLVRWDLTSADDEQRGGGGFRRPNFVRPGSYEFTVTAAGVSSSTELTVVAAGQ